MGLAWYELGERLDVSRTTLHNLRTGKKGPGVKLAHKIRTLEEEAGLVTKGAARASAAHVDEHAAWLDELRRQWKRKKPAHRKDMELALRVLFPRHAEEIVKWLNRR